MNGKAGEPGEVGVRLLYRRWGALWYSRNRRDGVSQHFLWEKGGERPALFHTRREARSWIAQNYGYIATRPDLRSEPHCWHVPRAVQVRIVVEQSR